MPVDLHRTLNVTGFVQQYVFVRLDDNESGSAQMCLKPIARNEAFRVGVIGELCRSIDFDGHCYLHVQALGGRKVPARDRVRLYDVRDVLISRNSNLRSHPV